MKRFLSTWLIKLIVFPLISLWFRSLQLSKKAVELPKDTILLFWHRHIFAVIAYLSRFSSERSLVALVSGSEDGRLLQTLLNAFGFSVVEGSSSDGGFGSLLKAEKILQNGATILITPDGPKGPAEKIKSGAILLARYSAKPIVCVHAQYQGFWQLGSWDRAILPKPFTHCEIISSKPFFIDRKVPEIIQTELKNRLEASLDGDQTCRRMEESLL
jgi:lysophospholipid acyltransferase (LPLAT)-like uncharacterized protein